MSGDHNMNQKKPTIKIDGVEINQTTPYIDYDAWIASPLTKALEDRLDAAVKAEREACAKVAEEEIARVKPLYSVTAENIVKQIRARGEKK
jgi:hypothetical protein